MELKSTKRTAPASQIIEISQRMYERSMRSIEKLEKKRAGKINPEDEERKQKCTFKPNTYKAKFNKFPQTNTYKSKVDLKIKPMTKQQKARKIVRKPISKLNPPEPPKRVSTCYDWDSKRKLAQTSRYFETEIQRSLEKDPKTKKAAPKTSSSVILNKSLDDSVSKIAGTNSFFERQERAKLMKQSKQFLLHNPTSHTWNFKQRLNSSLDTLSSHYLDFGDSAYSRYKNK